MGKVNVDYKRIARNSKSLKKTSDDIILKKYEINKGNFLREFEAHEVTKEIDGGASASNSSNTLNGIGNLFSFIGFSESDKPIENLSKLLEKSFSINTKRQDKNIKYIIDFPTINKIKSETPMPWEPGNSWAQGIEKGISGFSNYIYKRFVQGRSKEALQAEKRVRPGSYKKTQYLTEIINNFINNMTKK